MYQKLVVATSWYLVWAALNSFGLFITRDAPPSLNLRLIGKRWHYVEESEVSVRATRTQERRNLLESSLLLSEELACYEGYVGMPLHLVQTFESCLDWVYALRQKNVTGCLDTCVLYRHSLLVFDNTNMVRRDSLTLVINMQFDQATAKNSIELLLWRAYSCKDEIVPLNKSAFSLGQTCIAYSPFWQCLKIAWARECTRTSKRSLSNSDVIYNEKDFLIITEDQVDQKHIQEITSNRAPTRNMSPSLIKHTATVMKQPSNTKLSENNSTSPPAESGFWTILNKHSNKPYIFSIKTNFDGDHYKPYTTTKVPDTLDTSSTISGNKAKGNLESVNGANRRSKDVSSHFYRDPDLEFSKESLLPINEATAYYEVGRRTIKYISVPYWMSNLFSVTTERCNSREVIKYLNFKSNSFELAISSNYSAAPSNSQPSRHCNFTQKNATADSTYVEHLEDKTFKDFNKLEKTMSQIEPVYRNLFKRDAEFETHGKNKDNSFIDETSNGARNPNADNVDTSSGKTATPNQSFGRQQSPTWYLWERRRR